MKAPHVGRPVVTLSGRKVWPLAPEPSAFCIEDIAHALALQARHGGHTPSPRSFAEHAVRVARLVRGRSTLDEVADPVVRATLFRRLSLAALLHNAAHAYVGAAAAEFAEQLPGYAAAWERMQQTVNLWAGLPLDAHGWGVVAHAEALAGGPDPTDAGPWDWRTAEDEYLSLYWEGAEVPALPYGHVHPCPQCHTKEPCNDAGCVIFDATEHGIPLGGFSDGSRCSDCRRGAGAAR